MAKAEKEKLAWFKFDLDKLPASQRAKLDKGLALIREGNGHVTAFEQEHLAWIDQGQIPQGSELVFGYRFGPSWAFGPKKGPTKAKGGMTLAPKAK